MLLSARRSLHVSLAVLLAAVLAPIALPAYAQPDETTAAVVRDVHAFIMEYALRPVDPGGLLQRALAAAQLAAPGTTPPVLTGVTADDVAASADYVASALGTVPAAARDAGLAAVLRAMVRELADPFAAVFPPEAFTRFREELRGERGSIGVQIDTGAAGAAVISDVTPGGPAARDGIRPGDVIEQVGGRSTLFLTPDEVLRLLRGASGTVLTIVVRRGTVLRTLTLTRAVVRESATRARIVEARIGYLRLLEFSRQSGRELSRATSALQAGGAQVLILDLRLNGGGLVDEAVDIASVFLPDGVVALEERRAGTETLTVRQVDRFPGPVVILTDRATASASEIVAGALQDAGAPIVGLPTYGKTTVQGITIPPLPGGWGLRLTTARYLTRAGRNIDGTGLIPAVHVPMDPGLVQAPGDVQYREALTLARARLPARASP
jgi:carboxyl-terminal processing protease